MFRELRQFLFKKHIPQIVSEWQEGNRLALVALCVIFDLSLQWLGYSLIWFGEVFDSFVNINVMGKLWFVCGQTILAFIIILFYTLKNNDKNNIAILQYLMTAIYLIYTITTYISFGVVNIFVGVSLLSNTIIASLLMSKQLVWKGFIIQLFFLCVLILLPLININLPNVYAVVDNSEEEYYGSVFWLVFLVYLSIPKALLTVSVCFHLINGIESRLSQAEYHANYDELTQVTNRRYIMNYIYDILFLARSNSGEAFNLTSQPQDLSVIILDIDHFKSINDTYGHLSGDMVLIEVARRLKDMMTGIGWQVSRHGGEEFLIVLPQMPHGTAMEVAGEIHRKVSTESYKITDGLLIDATASFGVASFSHEEVNSIREQYFLEHQDDDINQPTSSHAERISEVDSSDYVVATQEDLIIESIINMADSALYDAKRLGRNRIVSANQYVDVEQSQSTIERNMTQVEFILKDVPIEVISH